jgi:hypothetical protein
MHCPQKPDLFHVKLVGTDSNHCNKRQQKPKEAPADKRKINISEVVKSGTVNGCGRQ